MAHIRILKIETSGGKTKTSTDGIVALPGTFANDREAMDSIKEDGEYLFLETHLVKGKPSKKKVTKSTVDPEINTSDDEQQ